MLSGLVGATTSSVTPRSLAAFSAPMRQAFQNGLVTFLTKNATVAGLPACAPASFGSTPSAVAPVASSDDFRNDLRSMGLPHKAGAGNVMIFGSAALPLADPSGRR